jgi:metal-responsive CopG/Arc/MetJ family transcriptional regulator
MVMKQTEKKVISLAIDKELLKKIDEANFNRSKLIDSLLTKHYVKKEK